MIDGNDPEFDPDDENQLEDDNAEILDGETHKVGGGGRAKRNYHRK